MPRRLAAEGVGTAFLLAAVIGSGIMAERLSGGNEGLALLCNAVATGAVLYVLITALGPISGAHFNPAVTLVAALDRRRPPAEAGLFALAQVGGGLAGMLAAHLMFAETPIQVAATVRTGPAQWFAEWVATFGLIATILVTAKARADAVPMAVALYITGAYWFTASTSFANPAVTVARGFSDTFAGIRPTDVAPFIAAQAAGAITAMVACRWLLNAPTHSPTEKDLP
ncbi:MAG: aquaporin [Inquilinaceae bacterium]